MNLIEKLAKVQAEYENDFRATGNRFSDAFANGIEQAADIVKQQNSWVSVSERLPKSPIFRLVDEEGEWFKARYFKGRWLTPNGLQVFPRFWYDDIISNPNKQIPVTLSEQSPSEIQP